MIATANIEDYLKEWEKTSAGNCRSSSWHLEWRKPGVSQCFKYVNIGNPSIISLKDDNMPLSGIDEYFIVWDFKKETKQPIYHIRIVKTAEKILYLSPFTGKLQ